MSEKKSNELSKSELASLIQYMAGVQKELVFENRILRMAAAGELDENQKLLLEDRVDSVLPYNAYMMGSHINMILERYPELSRDEYVKDALKDRDGAIETVISENKKDGYETKHEFNP